MGEKERGRSCSTYYFFLMARVTRKKEKSRNKCLKAILVKKKASTALKGRRLEKL